MRLRERLIHFQNKAEQDYEQQQTVGTTVRYVLAFMLFMGSTIFAGLTWPLRSLLGKAAKPAHDRIQTVTHANVDQLLATEPLILFDFWAEWCGPCLMMNPILTEFVAHAEGIVVAKVNADQEPQLVQQFQVRGLPQMILFRNGKEVRRHGGAMTQKELQDFCFA
jgi:thioredoxin 1